MRLSLPHSFTSHLGMQRPAHDMPARVHALVVEQEAQSERLIGWVQFALAVALTLLYSLSARPTEADMLMHEPVPWALGAYGLFTVGRLILSYRGAMPGWVLVLSILIDMALLIGLIWSFHIQYGQPASFSLQVPTFIYLFVFIALRALRFDPRFVLTAGIAAAAGWLLLVLYAESGADASVTRSFVTYITSTQILRGAEVEKIVTILLITGVLTLAIGRAQRTLLTAVKESAATKDMSRFLAPGVAQRITQSDAVLQAGEAASRDVAVLMIDIRGFSRFAAQTSPEDVVRMLTDYHARIVPLIQANGGTIDKFLGDGIMATFGATEPSETAAADGMRTLEAVLAETQRWRAAQEGSGLPQLDANAALAAGRVVFATVGVGDRLEYTVIGGAVNLAAKLEKHNKEVGSDALVADDALAWARTAGYAPAATTNLSPHSGQSVAGLADPTDLTAVSVAVSADDLETARAVGMMQREAQMKATDDAPA